MYFAIQQDVNDTEMYSYFLSDIINNNNQHYISIFQSIIKQSQELAKSNNFYAVKSERLGITSFFAKFEDKISKMNPNNLQRKDFEILKDCFNLEQQM